MVAYFEKKLKLPPVVESFSKLFNEVMPALSRVTRRLVEQVRGSKRFEGFSGAQDRSGRASIDRAAPFYESN